MKENKISEKEWLPPKPFPEIKSNALKEVIQNLYPAITIDGENERFLLGEILKEDFRKLRQYPSIIIWGGNKDSLKIAIEKRGILGQFYPILIFREDENNYWAKISKEDFELKKFPLGSAKEREGKKMVDIFFPKKILEEGPLEKMVLKYDEQEEEKEDGSEILN